MQDNYIPYGPEWEKELMKTPKKFLIDMIRRIKTKDHSESTPTISDGWIDVKDEKPEYEEMVLAWNGIAIKACVYKEWNKSFARWTESYGDERVYIVSYSDITHWKRISPPPKQ